MNRFYPLLLALLAAGPAVAQSTEEGQTTLDNVALVISGTPTLATTVTNLISGADLPPSYFPQDSSETFFVTVSAFSDLPDGRVGGTPIVGDGVTGQAVVALRADGSEALGCTSATDPTSDIANSAAFVGKVVMIRRGVCAFFLKATYAEQGGAIGFVVYNGADRKGNGPDAATNDLITGNMGGTPVEGDSPVGIPGVLIPNGIGQPISDAVVGGTAITLQIKQITGTAAEPGVSTTRSGLEVIGANPFRAATSLRLTSETAEAVRVDVFNVRGQQVATLFDDTLSGDRTLRLSSAGLAPGVYFVRATGQSFRTQVQLTVVR